MAKKRNVIVCTAWPYIHGLPHLGNFLQILSGCVLKRYYTHTGANVIHVSGSDVHGARMEFQAHKEGISPKELVTRNHEKMLGLLKSYNIDFTNYTWTESDVHKEFVTDTYRSVFNNGFIITKVEKKPYCNNCKTFLAERFISGTCPYCGFIGALGDQCDSCGRLLEPEELKEPKCEQCGKSDIVIKETKHWYLSLDKLQGKIEKYADSHPEWNEITKEYTYRWLKQGLMPRPITRDIKFAIKAPFPGSEGKTIYVWAEAVLGYVSASIEWAKKIGKPNAWKAFWKADCKQVYCQGKDNIPFHTIIFPGILIGTGNDYTLPTQISSTYFLNWEGGLKFSKTRGVGIWSDEALKVFGNPDVWRFYVMINRPEKRDREFSWAEFEKTVNSILVGSIGNLFNRCLTFIEKHYKSKLPKATLDIKVSKVIRDAFKSSSKIFEEGGISEALQVIIRLADFGNEYFQANEPWHNKKTGPKTLYNCYQIIKSLTVLLEPVIPGTAVNAWSMLGLKGDISKAGWSFVESKTATINKPELLFTKVEVKELMAKLEDVRKEKVSVPSESKTGLINYNDFAKVKLMTAKVLSAEPFGDKLLKLRVKADRERTILAGIKAYYKPEELVGKTIIIVANLEPKKIAGEMSDGMVLAGEKDGIVCVLKPDKELPEGSEIH